jgi:hypothetical protein
MLLVRRRAPCGAFVDSSPPASGVGSAWSVASDAEGYLAGVGSLRSDPQVVVCRRGLPASPLLMLWFSLLLHKVGVIRRRRRRRRGC